MMLHYFLNFRKMLQNNTTTNANLVVAGRETFGRMEKCGHKNMQNMSFYKSKTFNFCKQKRKCNF